MKELDCIISTLEPERKENGTPSFRLRPAVVHHVKTREARKKKSIRRRRSACGAWMVMFAVFAALACYLALAMAETMRRGYFSVGGELILAVSIGYIVYVMGSKKAPAGK